MSSRLLSHQGVPVVFIDIEASALEQGSYPVEIGWAPGRGREFDDLLIAPAEEWKRGGVWSDLSEKIHGIRREQLDVSGVTPLRAISRLEGALQGCLLISDAVEWDSYWLHRLYETEGRVCSFLLHPFDRIIRAIGRDHGTDPARITEHLEAWSNSEGQMHRAGPDAAENYRRAMAMIASAE